MNNQQPEIKRKISSKKQLYAAFVFVFVLFLFAIGQLVFDLSEKNKQLLQSYNELHEIHIIYAELENEYEAAISELDYFAGVSVELNQLIELQKTELEARRKDIVSLINTRTQLDEARSQIRALNKQVKAYISEIEQLQDEKMKLAFANEELTAQKDELFSRLNNQLLTNEQLTEAKAILVGQNEKLNRSVRVGSVVKVNDIRVEGLKIRSNGKTKVKKHSNQVDNLKICFTTADNDMVSSGIETFFVRIVNPRGETLALEELGSGYLNLEKAKENIRITCGTEVKYQNKEQDVCMFWSPDLVFIPGRYQVEVYNKGYLAGSGGFELK